MGSDLSAFVRRRARTSPIPRRALMRSLWTLVGIISDLGRTTGKVLLCEANCSPIILKKLGHVFLLGGTRIAKSTIWGWCHSSFTTVAVMVASRAYSKLRFEALSTFHCVW